MSLTPINYKECKHIIVVSVDFITILINSVHVIIGYTIVNFDSMMSYIQENAICEEALLGPVILLRFINDLLLVYKRYGLCNLYVYFINLTFSGSFILKYLLNYFEDFIIAGSSIYSFKLRNFLIWFRCMAMLLPINLDRICALVATSYISLFNNKFDYKVIKILLRYSRRIALILYHVLFWFNNFIKKLFGTSAVCITRFTTISVISKGLYRFKYITKRFYIVNTTYSKILRESYRGGICDIYKLYGRKLFYYDINSCFPFVMKTRLFPHILQNFDTSVDITRFDLFSFFGFLSVRLRVLETKIPFIIIKAADGSCIGPVGEYVVVIFSEELKYGMIVNSIEILEINYTLSYTSTNLFFSFVSYLYNKRSKANNSSEGLVYKLLLNTLYGRFGMKNNKDTTVMIDKSDYYLYEVLFCRSTIIAKAGNNYLVTKSSDIDYELVYNLPDSTLRTKLITLLGSFTSSNLYSSAALVHVASAVTSYSRVLLDGYKRKILYNSGTIFYCDTDSIVSDIKLDEFSSTSKLGFLKLVYFIKRALFLGPKAYILSVYGSRSLLTRLKGLPRSARMSIKDASFLLFKLNTNFVINYKSYVSSNIKLMEFRFKKKNYTFTCIGTKFNSNYNKDGLYRNRSS